MINNTDIYFGNPYDPDVNRQPYIIIASRRDTESVIQEMGKNAIDAKNISEVFSPTTLLKRKVVFTRKDVLYSQNTIDRMEGYGLLK